MVKHADGMRGPPQPASMVEAETLWWTSVWDKDPCEEFGAERHVNYVDWCTCPYGRQRLTKECGGEDGLTSQFDLSKATKGCRCVSWAELREIMTIPVSASALRFCSALVEHSYNAPSKFTEEAMQDTLNKTSPQICQHALTGTITPKEAKEDPWAEKASELSQERFSYRMLMSHLGKSISMMFGLSGIAKMEGTDEDREYGRMRPVKETAKTPREKKLWEDALSHVCKDECDDLLHMMKKETRNLANDVAANHIPYAQACAERVVQHVEAEVLGCCARSCGFDGHTCLLWPFFSLEEKVTWDVECCGEMSVLKNSSRERMCNSVLPGRLAKEASKFDPQEEDGTDVGKVLIGQNTSLFWTKKGAQEARDGIKSNGGAWGFDILLNPFGKSVLIKEEQALADTKVTMDFLLKHPNVGEEFLRRGYFREEPVTKMLNEATSVMQVSSHDGTCDFGKFKEQCPPEWMETYTARCKEAWMVAGEHEEFGNLKEQVEHHLVFGNCYVNDHIDVASPKECENIATNSLNQKKFLHYFEYNKENSKKPIKCFTLSKGSKELCKGEPDWWTNIPLKSVQDVIKEDITDYKDLVYVKLKTD